MAGFFIKALINILIQKGIFTQEEYNNEINRLKKIDWDERHRF